MYTYKELTHTADVAVAIRADTQEDLFRGSLEAMFALMEPIYAQTDEHVSIPIKIQAPNVERLLVDFLSHVLALSDVYNCVYELAHITESTPTTLGAQLRARAVNRFGLEVKAVTYHDFELTRSDEGYQATIVFDI